MPHRRLDRSLLHLYPLAARPLDKVLAERDMIAPDREPVDLSPTAAAVVKEAADRMRKARAAGRPTMMTFGAHTIKNGLGPVINALLEAGWLQHLATNGAGIIHDWELAYQGKTGEDVRENTRAGMFGIWEETGLNLNLALAVGAYDGLGYGEAVGRLIETGRHVIPERAALRGRLAPAVADVAMLTKAAAAADLLAVLERLNIESGTREVNHPWRDLSVQARAFRLGIPFTAHPMIGHDIIYTHPASHGAAIGRAAERDFLSFAHAVTQLDGGVYLSVGSAVMSPMVFEKSLAMAQNLALQAGRCIEEHYIAVVDLAESRWDWNSGEPPEDSPDYYLRYCKTFSRMGGTMRYVTADNRDFLLGLCQELGAG